MNTNKSYLKHFRIAKRGMPDFFDVKHKDQREKMFDDITGIITPYLTTLDVQEACFVLRIIISKLNEIEQKQKKKNKLLE